jgi:hypothetical protein
MSTKRDILTTLIAVATSVFLVAGIVLAVTTIGTDISTDGNLTVGGNTTVSGTLGVTGATTLGTLTVSGDTSIGGNLNVTGDSILLDPGWVTITLGSISVYCCESMDDLWWISEYGRIYARDGIRTDGDIIIDSSTANLTIPAGALSDGSVLSADIADLAIKKSKIDYEVVSVDIIPGADNGTATVTSGAEILGFYPTTNDGKVVNSISISGTTLTLTVGSTSTATSTFNVVLVKP